MHVQRNARRDEILKFFGVSAETIALLIPDVLGNYTLFLVFHLRWNHVEDTTDKKIPTAILFILGGILAIQGTDRFLYLSHLDDVARGKVGVDGIGHSADQQIPSKQIHDVLVHFLTQAFLCHKLTVHGLYRLPAETIGYEKFLKIQLVHLFANDASDGDGSGGA